MKSDQNRRQFIKSCSSVGFTCLSIMLYNQRLLADAKNNSNEKDVINLENNSYCGIPCNEVCDLYKASINNDIEKKKEFYHKWNWEKKFGFDFDSEKVFCYTCKPKNNKLKVGMAECTVRQCAIEKKFESCIQCEHLTACDKELWKNWPDFHKQVIEGQKKYLERKS